MRRLIVIVITCSLKCISLTGQDSFDCSTYYSGKNFNDPPTELITVYDNPARPVNGFAALRIENDSEEGKIFIQLVVDELGNVHCTRILKSENTDLNDRALKLIDSTEFIPATQQGKSMPSIVNLVIIYGRNKMD